LTIVYKKCKKKSMLPIKYYGRIWKGWNKYIEGGVGEVRGLVLRGYKYLFLDLFDTLDG